MLYCIALYCIVLYCVVLRCVALRCVALRCVALHCIALHCIALHCIALYCIVLYCIVLYGIVGLLYLVQQNEACCESMCSRMLAIMWFTTKTSRRRLIVGGGGLNIAVQKSQSFWSSQVRLAGMSTRSVRILPIMPISLHVCRRLHIITSLVFGILYFVIVLRIRCRTSWLQVEA